MSSEDANDRFMKWIFSKDWLNPTELDDLKHYRSRIEILFNNKLRTKIMKNCKHPPQVLTNLEKSVFRHDLNPTVIDVVIQQKSDIDMDENVYNFMKDSDKIDIIKDYLKKYKKYVFA